MTLTGLEVTEGVFPWLAQKISALPSIVSGNIGVYSVQAPQGTGYPVVLYGPIEGTLNQRRVVGPFRIWVDAHFWVNVVVQERNWTRAGLIYGEIDSALELATGSVGGYSIRGCIRISSIVSTDQHQRNDGIEVRRLGGVYRIIVQ